MKTELSEPDYHLLLETIEGIHRCRRLDDFPRHALTELRKLIVCRVACYAELDYGRQRAVNVFDPPATPNREWFEKSIHEHPVLNHFLSTGDGQALKISDFLSEDAFHQLVLYQQAFRLVGVEDEMGFGVQCERRFVLGFSFHRGERSFTERDRMLLNFIRPHVVQAYMHLEELAGCDELQLDLQTALREHGLGVMVVNRAREIIHMTPGVRGKLAQYVPMPGNALTLPESLANWAFAAKDASDLHTLGAEPARLILRRKRRDDDRLLLLVSEENSAAAAQKLAAFGLTPRELEVFRWVAQGKSNAEIARILGVSPGTAKTHVEHILAKLGVDNRTAAAALLHSVGI